MPPINSLLNIPLQNPRRINNNNLLPLSQNPINILVRNPPRNRAQRVNVLETQYNPTSVHVASTTRVVGVGFADLARDGACQALGPGESHGAAHFEDDDFARAVRVVLARAGAGDDGGDGGLHGGARDLADVHHVQAHVARELLADDDDADAVAALVEFGGEGCDADLAGQGADDAACDAAFGGDADVGDPVAGGVVHAAGCHDGEDLADAVDVADDLLAGDGVDAGVAEGGGHHGQVVDVDVDGALADVALDGLARVARDDARGLQHVGDAHVAVGGAELGLEDLLVDVQLAAGQAGQHVEDARGPLLGGGVGPDDERVRCDGAGVDHGVHGLVGAALEGQLVEPVAGGLDADLLEHLGQAGVLDGDGVDEGL